MILLDSSAWIALFRRPSRVRLQGDDLLRVATCAPIIQEVLQGVREDRAFEEIRESLEALPRLSDPIPAHLYIEAARLYRRARKKGLTVRSSTDCLIAVIALENQVPVHHLDRDFDELAKFCDLESVRL